MQQVRVDLKKQFERVFGIKFVSKDLDDLSASLENFTLADSV
jgi:hypothetical protein